MESIAAARIWFRRGGGAVELQLVNYMLGLEFHELIDGLHRRVARRRAPDEARPFIALCVVYNLTHEQEGQSTAAMSLGDVETAEIAVDFAGARVLAGDGPCPTGRLAGVGFGYHRAKGADGFGQPLFVRREIGYGVVAKGADSNFGLKGGELVEVVFFERPYVVLYAAILFH